MFLNTDDRVEMPLFVTQFNVHKYILYFWCCSISIKFEQHLAVRVNLFNASYLNAVLMAQTIMTN